MQTTKKCHDIRKHTSPERGSVFLSTKPSDIFQELSVHQNAFQHILGEKVGSWGGSQKSGGLLAFLDSYCFCEMRMVL